MIPYGRQQITDEDINAVIDVLRSDWLTQGPAVPAFEEALAAHVGSGHAVAVSNATAALHIACRALGLGGGDLLWTSPNTFVASANCGLYCGAEVDFVDIDPRTYNMSSDALALKLKTAKAQGRLPKVVVPVHFAGQSCNMRAIADLASEYGFKIIEDASHAVGGKYQGQAVGSCRFSDITVFSFHPVKIITTAEGGMALTNQADLAERMRLLRSHGITRDDRLMTAPAEGAWYYQQVDLGLNYRMTDMQAALGLSQLARLEEYVARRQYLAGRYDKMLSDLPVICPWQDPENSSAFHLYPICLDPAKTDRSRKMVFDFLRSEGVGVNVHYIPVHTQPYYQNFGFSVGDFLEAERYYAGAISLPLFPTLTENDQDKVVSKLYEVLS